MAASRIVATAIAVGLAVAGLVLMGTAMHWSPTPRALELVAAPEGNTSPSPSPTGGQSVPGRPSVRAGQVDVRDRITGPMLPESDPVEVSIPRIGVRSTLVELGLDEDGAMEVPEPEVAGWFTRGAAPGALGPAVIAGHVTWNGAPAVFHRLADLRRGNQITVQREDGRVAVFSVTRVARYAKSRFPSGAVYGAIDHAGLRLITCGGTYDSAGSRYLDNVVVFARLESVRRHRG